MCIVVENKKQRVFNGYIGKKMFDKDFVLALSHEIASKYFPKQGDMVFYDKTEAFSFAKRICINALQRGININTLEFFAKKAQSVEVFNKLVGDYFGKSPEESRRPTPYINLYKKERDVLLKVFVLTESEIEALSWGRLSLNKVDAIYEKAERLSFFLDKKINKNGDSPNLIIKFLSIRWGLEDGYPKSIREVSMELGISDGNNHKIKTLMNSIFDALLEYKKSNRF